MSDLKLISLAAAVVALGACSDGVGPAASGSQRLNLMVATGPAAGAAAPAESVTVSNHKIVFEKVELVLDRVRLRRVESSVQCDDDQDDKSGQPNASGGESGNDGNNHGEGEHDDDACEKFVAGPMLLDLPLGGATSRLVTVDVDTGTYNRVEFKLHKPEDCDDGNAFLTAHPDLAGISVRVTGTFDGNAFVFTTDVSAKQRSQISPPLSVTAHGATDLTLIVDLTSWFVRSDGSLMDPIAAATDHALENAIRDNIRRSFRMFKDHDHDGREDND